MIPDPVAIAWYWIVGMLFLVYALLDGIDLGASFWFLSAPPDERKQMLSLTGPSWNGNALWLLATTCALFAAFPPVFTATLRGFFPMAAMVVTGLAIRAIVAEILRHIKGRRVAMLLNIVFTLFSALPPLALGVLAGNLLMGVPLDESGAYPGPFIGLLTHYSITAGLLLLFMFATHGTLFLALKAASPLRERAAVWAKYSWYAYLFLFVDMTIWSVGVVPHISVNFFIRPLRFLIPLAGLTALFTIKFFLKRCRIRTAFIASSVSMVVMFSIFGLSIYPFLIPTFYKPGTGISIANAAAPRLTLFVMFAIAAVVIPALALYTRFMFRKYRTALGVTVPGEECMLDE
jgi:cytochrome bd ubiquinol oxidase subunit II